MSRSGKRAIPIPKGVEVRVAGSKVTVKGPKGELSAELSKGIAASVDQDGLVVAVEGEIEDASRWHGLNRATLNNLVIGASKGFQRRLQLTGVGYRASVQGAKLALQLGFSHPTELEIPKGLEVKVDKNTLIEISGTDKQRVGQFAAAVRSLRPPEPYKGKGVAYEGEYIRRKAGKSGKK